MPDVVRQTALAILNRLDQERQTLDSLVADCFSKDRLGDRRNRSLLQAIVFGVSRWRGRLDWIISHFSRIRLDKIEAEILNILRIGLFQIIYLDRVPVSAAVDTAVELSKSAAGPWVVRYVNAVLRRAAREYQAVSFPRIEVTPVRSIAATRAFPEWLVHRWHMRLGVQDTVALCDAVNTIPPVTLRTNTLKTDRSTLMKALEKEVGALEAAPCSPLGIKVFSLKKAIAHMDAFQKGWFQVQDEAAQLVTLLLDPQPGETVLDACAGLGGKSGHLAQAMQNEGHILALDHHPGKLQRLQLEMQRLGIGIADTRVHDLYQTLKPYPCGGFDRILLDAPCSGLGVLRRNPDAKWSAKSRDVNKFHRRQVFFLRGLLDLLKPGGVLVYAVCSLEPEEGEAVVQAALEDDPVTGPAIKVDAPPAGFPSMIPSPISAEGHLYTLPHLHDMDGFFAVRLKRDT